MKPRNLTLSAAAVVVIATSGCATVTRGTTQSVAVDTVPQQALVSASSGPACLSPCALDLKRSVAHTLTATLAGHQSKSAVVSPQVGGGGAAGMAGNILLGGIIGAGVDAASGAMYDLTPSRVTMVLDPIE